MNIFYFFFFIHGLFTIISQITIIRELIIAFYGNELFSGIVLAIWFLGAGLGSFWALKIKRFKSWKQIFSIQLLLFSLFPLEILLIRFLIGKTVYLGEIPPFFQSSMFVFLLLFPFSFFLNALFSWTTSFWIQKQKKIAPAFLISRAYLLETIGLVIGGLIFNFFLITSTFPFPSSLNIKSLKFRFPNLVESVNSRYGNIAVTKINQQYNFYESGQFIGSNKEIEANEYLAHLILTQHQEPKNILIIGGGLNGLIFETLKYQSIEKIDYLEIDPKLIEVSQKYLADYLIKAVNDPKVKIHLVDGRQFLQETAQKYDLIIFNLNNPSTALINRFYTQECYQLVEKALANNGLLATSIYVPVDYLSEEARNLVGLINQTLKSVFPYQLNLPEEDSILFLASKENIFLTKPDLVKERFLKNNIKTQFFSADYLEYRLQSPKIKQLTSILKEQKEKKLNTDFYPLAYFFESAFWQTMFSFKTAKILNVFGSLDFKIILTVLIAIQLLIFSFIKKRSTISFLIVLLTGFSLIVFEILIIFIFQAVLGYVFSKIALIFTLVLTGLGLGNFWATKKKISVNKSIKLLKKALFSIIIYCFLFLWLIKKIPTEMSFYVLAMIIGFLSAIIFPLGNKIILAKDKKAYQKTGFLYSADLLGAFGGAILASVFLIPIFGVSKTVYLLIIINIFELIILIEPTRLD